MLAIEENRFYFIYNVVNYYKCISIRDIFWLWSCPIMHTKLWNLYTQKWIHTANAFVLSRMNIYANMNIYTVNAVQNVEGKIHWNWWNENCSAGSSGLLLRFKIQIKFIFEFSKDEEIFDKYQWVMWIYLTLKKRWEDIWPPKSKDEEIFDAYQGEDENPVASFHF